MKNEIKDKIDTACSNLCGILQRKNADYGNSALEKPCLVNNMTSLDGIMVRLGDKFSRLRTIYGAENHQTNESVQDTLTDIAGYCILALIASDKRDESLDEPIIRLSDKTKA